MSGAAEQQWYIVQHEAGGHCDIVTQAPADTPQVWGPFATRGDAIARRVGLIRAGKCQPRQ